MRTRLDRTFLVLAALGIGFRLLLALTGWVEGATLSDDAYYYYIIAENVAAGHGSTFDGLAPTNGYHPLWMLTLAGLFRWLPSHPCLPLRVADRTVCHP